MKAIVEESGGIVKRIRYVPDDFESGEDAAHIADTAQSVKGNKEKAKDAKR